MCGRFSIDVSWEELCEWYNLIDSRTIQFNPNYNVCPSQKISIIVGDDEPKKPPRFISARWGLVPSWWKKSLRELPSTINARAETVHERPMFRSAFKSRRCLIPVSGFYEWKRTEEAKQPFYITITEGHPMTLAGLWEEWTNPETGEIIPSVAILTVSANSFMKKMHHRMPVILDRTKFSQWLTEGGHNLLKPCPDSWLDIWPVSTEVNSPRNNHIGLMSPRTETGVPDNLLL